LKIEFNSSESGSILSLYDEHKAGSNEEDIGGLIKFNRPSVSTPILAKI
jgi:hypothetical protein